MPLQLDLLAGVNPEPATPSQEPPTVDDMRRHLEGVRSATLDELRKSIGSIPTSQLLILMASGTIPLSEHEESLPPPDVHMLITAGLLAIADELDQRIPPRLR